MPKKKEGRTATKDLIESVKAFEVKTKELRIMVDALPDSSVKDAFEYSVLNLEKKCGKFLTTGERFKLTPEEKALILQQREKKISPIQGINANMDREEKPTGKRGKK